jgi:hypothetical protein
LEVSIDNVITANHLASKLKANLHISRNATNRHKDFRAQDTQDRIYTQHREKRSDRIKREKSVDHKASTESIYCQNRVSLPVCWISKTEKETRSSMIRMDLDEPEWN